MLSYTVVTLSYHTYRFITYRFKASTDFDLKVQNPTSPTVLKLSKFRKTYDKLSNKQPRQVEEY